MSCFTKETVNNPKFPVFSKRMAELKSEERGVSAVCDLMEQYIREGREEGRAEGREEGREDIIKRLLKSGMTSEEIHTRIDIPLAEVKLVEASL